MDVRMPGRVWSLAAVIVAVGAAPGTEFKLTSWDGREAVFENPAHDCPQLIRYTKNDNGSLTASVEGDQGGRAAKEEFRYEHSAK